MAKNELKGKTGKLLDDLMNGERNKDKGRWKGEGMGRNAGRKGQGGIKKIKQPFSLMFLFINK